jgi:hypothetical protein
MGFLTNRLALFPISSYSLRSEGAIYIPMPTLLLYLFLPFFSAMRVWTRLGVIAIFGVAALAGLGWQRLEGGSLRLPFPGPMRPALARILVVALVAFEFAAFPYAMGTSSIQARPVDHWLAAQPGDWAIIEYPVAKAMSGRSLYAMRTHGKSVSFGYGTFFPQVFNEARPLLDTFPSSECIALLQSWGVRYVLVGSRSYGSDWARMEQACASAAELRHVLTSEDTPSYEGDRVLRLLPGTERAFVVDRIYVYEVL